MRKTFLSGLGIVLLLNVMIKPAYVLGIEAAVQNAVGAESYGLYAAILSLSFLFNIVLDFGMTNFNTRNIAQNQQLLNKHFSGLFSLRFVLAVVYFVLIFSVGSALGYLKDSWFIFTLLSINQFLASGILYLRSNLNGLLLFKQDAVVSVLDRALLIIGLGIILLFPEHFGSFQIEWLVIAQSIAYGFTFLFAFAMVFRKLEAFRIQLKLPFAWMIIKKSLPFALLILLSMAYYKTDSVMLERMLPDGDYHAGIYAMGFRFFEASNMIGFLFAGLLLPLFSRLFKLQESIAEVAQTAFQMLLSLGIILASFCYLYGSNILNLFYSNHQSEALLPFQLLMCAFVFVLVGYLFSTILTAKGELKKMNFLAVGGVALNIGLNIILIQKWQETGSALASLITQGLVCLLQIGLVLHLVKLRFRTKTILSMIFFLLLVGILMVSFTIIHWTWWLEGGLFVILTSACAVLTGFVQIKQFAELFDRS